VRPASDVMRDLAMSGLTAEQLALVMELSASLGGEVRRDPVADKRRAYDRERKRKSTGIPPESVEVVSPKEYISNPHPVTPSAKADTPLDDFPNRVVETWNTETAGTPLPKARPLTPDRRKHLAVRAKEHGEDAVFAAIRNMAASEFHSGKSGKWTEGNLGWLLKSPENFTKMLERSTPQSAKQSVPVEQTIRARQDQARIYRRMGRESEADELDRETERIRKAAGIGEILHRMPPNPTPQAEGMR